MAMYQTLVYGRCSKVIIVFLFFAILNVSEALNRTVCEMGKNAIDDNYCDCPDGSDEPHTSACSGIGRGSASTRLSMFMCSESGPSILQKFIPASRVNDGICDCCDGSDEAANPHASCADSCGDILTVSRKLALQEYRNIQAGIAAKNEKLDTHRRRREKEDRVVALLLSEEKAMKETLFNMQYQLVNNEIRRENRLRMKLVREREIDCAAGLVDSCDLYFYGFHNDQELIYEGIPAQYNTPAAPRTRPQYQHSQKERDFLLKLNGLERIRASLCLEKVLLPDESPRIFGTLGEYMTYHYSDLKKEKSRRTMQEIRRDAMFGAYTESEDFGWLLLGTTLTEAIGIVASPITVGYGFLETLAIQHLINPTYTFMEECVNATVLEQELEVRRNAEEMVEKVGQSEPTCVPRTESAGTSEHDDNIEFCDASMVSTHVPPPAREPFCSPHMYTLSQLVVDSQTKPGSTAFVVVKAFEFEQYPEVSAVLEYMQPVIMTISWMVSVMAQAPYIYYDYYVGHNDYVRLPQTRNSCLLRSGLEAGKVELQKLKSKIRNELVYQQEKANSAKKKQFSINVGAALTFVEEKFHLLLSAVGLPPPPSMFSSLDLDVAALHEYIYPNPATSASGVMDPVTDALSQFGSKVWNNFMQELSTLFGDHTAEFAWLHDYEEVGGGGETGRHPKKSSTDSGSVSSEPARKHRADMDFGPDRAWELLYAPPPPSDAITGAAPPGPACISNKIDKYTYELCYFDTVYQDGTILGRFDRWETLSEADNAQMLADSVVQELGQQWLQKAKAAMKPTHNTNNKKGEHNYNLQLYNNGARCVSHGKSTPRSVNVHYYCGASKEGVILAVRETEMCKYEMLVSIAFACQDSMEKRSLQLLDELGVFGFSKKVTGNSRNGRV